MGTDLVVKRIDGHLMFAIDAVDLVRMLADSLVQDLDIIGQVDDRVLHRFGLVLLMIGGAYYTGFSLPEPLGLSQSR